MRNLTQSPKPFSNQEIAAFCEQLSYVLKSGISSTEGIAVMLEDARTDEEKQILTLMQDKLNETGNLAEAFKVTGMFPPYLLHMVQIGEESGTLDTVMESLSVHYDKEAAIRQNIKSSVTYPLFMACMILVIILVLLIKVMPIFNQVFVQLGTEMTGFSRTLMNLGNLLHTNALVFAIILVAIAGFLFFGLKTQKGIALLSRIAHSLPFTRKLYEKIAACRFADAMALTLASGLMPERSLELAYELNDDPYFAKKLDTCRELTDQGKNLSDALHEAKIFTGSYARMITLASRTGNMEQVMRKISDMYQDEIDTQLSNRLSVLEPTLVIVLSLIVGVILLSVILPLMGILSSI
jgi:type IV pilus assembly protein PilC